MIFERLLYLYFYRLYQRKEKYAHTDRLGSSSAVTDGRGRAVHLLSYMPYCETLLSDKYPPLLQHSYRANNMVNRVVLDDMAGETILNIL